MTDRFAELLAAQGNGAVEVDLPEHEPLMLVLAGPIKVWWGRMETPEYQAYATWRQAVHTAAVAAGNLVYAPHLAWRGAWHEKAQHINNAAIEAADALIVVTPEGVEAVGTAAETAVAHGVGIPVFQVPPSLGEQGIHDLVAALELLANKKREMHNNITAEFPGIVQE